MLLDIALPCRHFEGNCQVSAQIATKKQLTPLKTPINHLLKWWPKAKSMDHSIIQIYFQAPLIPPKKSASINCDNFLQTFSPEFQVVWCLPVARPPGARWRVHPSVPGFPRRNPPRDGGPCRDVPGPARVPVDPYRGVQHHNVPDRSWWWQGWNQKKRLIYRFRMLTNIKQNMFLLKVWWLNRIWMHFSGESWRDEYINVYATVTHQFAQWPRSRVLWW